MRYESAALVISDFESFIGTGGIVKIRHTFGRRGIFQFTNGACVTFTSHCYGPVTEKVSSLFAFSYSLQSSMKLSYQSHCKE